MRFVITGVAGFLGSHIGEALLEADHDVVGIDCFGDYYDPRLKEQNAAPFEVMRGDLAEGSIAPLLRETDGIFHLAAQPGARSFGDVFPHYLRNNVLASQRLFESAAAAGVRVVFASSSSVYGDAETYPTPEDAVPMPRSPYGITKLSCEHLARAYAQSFQLDVVILRYFTVYGPRQRPDMSFARIGDALLNDTPFEVYGDGTQSRSFTYVSDAVEATIAAMERAPSDAVYNVGGGAEATLRNAIGCFERIAGKKLVAHYAPAAAGDVRRTAADIDRIGADLGWKPLVGLDEGLRAQWQWTVEREKSAVTHR